MTITLDQAFDYLAAATRALNAGDRQVTAAGVKSYMRLATEGEFDETAVGFATFRDFLHEGERRKVISIHEGRYDLVVTPPGVALPPAPPASRTDPATRPIKARRIQSDLWRTFVNWSPGLGRYYDRDTNEAFVLPAHPGPRESGDQQIHRESLRERPDSFLKIEPIPFDEQLQWMRDFTEDQPSPIKEQLQLALSSERPARDFSIQVRGVPKLNSGWNLYRVAKVGAVIERWASANNVDLTIWRQQPVPAASASPAPGGAREGQDDGLRAALHRAIDLMPEHELHKLTIPVGYLAQDLRQR